jgi:light-regulated signal transduction histidine kinase (bacteriophytochrome)
MPEREELETRIQTLESDLRRCEEELREVTRMTAHDLRGAVRTISTHAELIGEMDEIKLHPRVAQRLATLADAARQLNALADGLASYSAALENNADLHDVPMETVLRLVMEKLEAPIRKTEAIVTHGPLPKIPGNMDLLTRLLENLVGNALRYRGPKAPVIHVSAEKRGGNWVFSVRDNGDGIDPLYRQTIFAPFKRLHSREQSGTGLGLTICRHITDFHRGTIWVESNPAGGSTFFVTLPEREGTAREA